MQDPQIDRIVALDDFDLEKAATLREHLRIPGLGETPRAISGTNSRCVCCAAENGIPVPDSLRPFTTKESVAFSKQCARPVGSETALNGRSNRNQEVPSPAGRSGTASNRLEISSRSAFWNGLYPAIFSMWIPSGSRGEPAYAVASGYGTPPLEVSHDGGIFTTRILERDSEIARGLLWLNERVLRTFRLTDGVSHTEFIRAHEDGALYFLETSARVGGAHISD